MSDAVNRLIIRDEGAGKISVALRRAGQEEAERAGEPFAFTFPLDAQAREDLRWYLEDYLLAPYAVWEDRGQAIADKLAGWGEALFQAVFGAGKPYGAYTRAREGLAELVIHAASPDLLGLPWELLKDPDRPGPLALEADIVGIDRTFEVSGAATEAPPGESLRVLMVIARPGGEEDVQYQMIARPLLERLSAVRGRVALEVLRPPTFDALEQRLERAADDGRPYHVLHFDGHGVLQRGAGGGGAASGALPRDRYQAGGKGYVLFEQPRGGVDRVAAADLARIVRAGRVPLVVLNACQSGAMSEQADAAVATRLLLDGAASVVAMGYIVYAVAAAEFMAAFYQALFEGKVVSTAVDAGRERLARKAERPSPKGPLPLADWMLPVHYRRRAVAFAQLRPAPAQTELSLDAALDQMRTAPRLAPEQPGADVHAEGSIEPVGRFVGRDSFVYTLELACRHHRVVLVHGPGGTGKTELAKAFARWWRDTGGLGKPDWVFFHSFEPGLASFGLGGVINALGIRLFGADFIGRTEGPEQRRTLILQTLRQRRMLLIWDNFESVFSMPDPGGATPPLSQVQRDEMAAFLTELRAPEGESALILTSRTTEDWLGEVRRVALGGLSTHERNEYADDLLAPYPATQTKRAAKEFGALMQWLAGHPLSMRLILPRLQETTAGALLAGLKGQGALPEGFEAAAGRLESLGASVKYSLDHLPADIQKLLPVVSLFEGVTFAPMLADFSGKDEVPRRFAAVSLEAWQAALEKTAQVGLLTPLGRDQYLIHPALPAYLVAQWSAEAGNGFEAERTAARHALIAAYVEFSGWLVRHILTGAAETAFALIDRQRRTMGELLAFALKERLYPEVEAILYPLNEFWDARGLALEAAAWANRVRATIEGHKCGIPDLNSNSGALWLFAVGCEANRTLDAGNLVEALATFDAIRIALEAAPANERRNRNLSVAYHNIGNVALERGDVTAAEEWYQNALALAEGLGDYLAKARGYHQLGRVVEERGDFDAAEKWYQKSLAITETLHNLPWMARSYHQLGGVAEIHGDLATAENWYQRALAIFETLDDKRKIGAVYSQIGNVEYLRANFSAAEDYYKKSLVIFHGLDDRPGISICYHQLGIVAQYRDELVAAESWYRKSLEIEEELGNRPGMAGSYHQLAQIAYLRGDLNVAEGLLRKVLAITESLGDRPGMALAYGSLGVLAEANNKCTVALNWTVKGVALFDCFPHPSTGEGPSNLVSYTQELGLPALEESWLRCTGQPLPGDVRAYVEQRLRDGDA